MPWRKREREGRKRGARVGRRHGCGGSPFGPPGRSVLQMWIVTLCWRFPGHVVARAIIESVVTLQTKLESEVSSLKAKVQSLQVDLDNSEAVQRDFVKLSQSLQVLKHAHTQTHTHTHQHTHHTHTHTVRLCTGTSSSCLRVYRY